MKILFISYTTISLSKKGGVRSVAMLRALADADHKIDLVSPHYDLPEHPNIRWLNKSEEIPKSRTKLQFESLRAILRGSYSAIHAVDDAIFFAARLARWKKIPLVYDASRCFSGKAAFGLSGAWKWFPKHVRAMELRALGQAAVIFSTCTALTTDLKGINAGVEPVQLPDIPIQPLCARPEIERSVLLDPFGKRPSTLVVCDALPSHTVGLRNLLLAVRKVVDTEPGTAIFFNGVLREPAEKMAASLDISNHCIFLESDDPAPFLSALGIAAAVLLVPQAENRYIHPEVYTLLHVGTPLVAIQNAAYNEVLTEQTSVRVLPNPDSIAEGLLRVIQEPLFSLAIAHEGQQLMADHHTYSSFKHNVRMTYQQLSSKG